VLWDIDIALWIVCPLLGMVGMFSGGYWGVGCGWLIVPTMLLLGLSPMEAVGIALLQMVPAILPTVVKTYRDIKWSKGSLGRSIILPMAIGSFLTSFTGDPINRALNAAFGDKALMLLFMIVMIFIGCQTAASRAIVYSRESATYTGKSSVGAWVAGLFTGVFSSVLGVGGAVVMRPALASLFKVSEKETSTSIRILLLVTTLTGGLHYLWGGGAFQWKILVLTLLISIGGMIGFPLGVKLHDHVARCGYTQHIHKSFSVIAAIVITSSTLKLCGWLLFSRYLMLVFAAMLVCYLVGFGVYAAHHAKR